MPRGVNVESDGAPHESTPFMSKSKSNTPPVDSGRLVWFIALLNGIGVLMPWNMFITIAPKYYVEFWFSQGNETTDYAKNFMTSLGIASQLPNVLINLLNIIFAVGGALMLRVAGPLALNCVLVSVVIALVTFVQPTMDAMNWFYYLTLCIVALMNLANGLYQNSIYGVFADFPAQYSNALVLGNNVCGTFTTLLGILVTSLIKNDIRLTSIIYFSVALTVLIFCCLSLISLVRNNYYRYHVEKGNEARALEASSGKPGLQQYLECFKICWVHLFNVFFIFFVTLTIFPAMQVATPFYKENETSESVWGDNLFVLVTTFLNFNLFATLGSFLANFVQFPKPKFLWLPVVLRGLFIPFFMFCNYRPDDRTLPVIFKNEWFFTGAGALMAFTSGYFSSLAMMYAPRVVPQSQAKIAAMTAALCLVLGIFAGVSFTIVVAFITTHA